MSVGTHNVAAASTIVTPAGRVVTGAEIDRALSALRDVAFPNRHPDEIRRVSQGREAMGQAMFLAQEALPESIALDLDADRSRDR